MRRALSAFLLLFAFLQIFAGTASARVDPGLKNRIWDFEKNPNIDTYGEWPLARVDAGENTTAIYDPATGVVFYVNQNPWSKFDPLGLREKTKSEKRNIDKMKDEAVSIRQQVAENEYKDKERGRTTKPNKYVRDLQTAEALDESARMISEEIEKVVEGEKDPDGLSVALNALSIWGDDEKSKGYDKDYFTCNQFCYDVLNATGMRAPIRNTLIPRRLFGSAPMGAKTWYGEDRDTIGTRDGAKGTLVGRYRSSRFGYKGLKLQGREAKLGEVISYNGHVAISLGSGLAIGASQYGPVGSTNNGVTIAKENPGAARRFLKPERQPTPAPNPFPLGGP